MISHALGYRLPCICVTVCVCVRVFWSVGGSVSLQWLWWWWWSQWCWWCVRNRSLHWFGLRAWVLWVFQRLLMTAWTIDDLLLLLYRGLGLALPDQLQACGSAVATSDSVCVRLELLNFNLDAEKQRCWMLGQQQEQTDLEKSCWGVKEIGLALRDGSRNVGLGD